MLILGLQNIHLHNQPTPVLTHITTLDEVICIKMIENAEIKFLWQIWQHISSHYREHLPNNANPLRENDLNLLDINTPYCLTEHQSSLLASIVACTY